MATVGARSRPGCSDIPWCAVAASALVLLLMGACGRGQTPPSASVRHLSRPTVTLLSRPARARPPDFVAGLTLTGHVLAAARS